MKNAVTIVMFFATMVSVNVQAQPTSSAVGNEWHIDLAPGEKFKVKSTGSGVTQGYDVRVFPSSGPWPGLVAFTTTEEDVELQVGNGNWLRMAIGNEHNVTGDQFVQVMGDFYVAGNFYPYPLMTFGYSGTYGYGDHVAYIYADDAVLDVGGEYGVRIHGVTRWPAGTSAPTGVTLTPGDRYLNTSGLQADCVYDGATNGWVVDAGEGSC